MRVIFVVDSITDVTAKIEKMKSRFGKDISLIVKAPFVDLLKTYGYTPSDVYISNLSDVMHNLILKCNVDNIVIYYSSLQLDDSLINKFIKHIGEGKKIVNVMPYYSAVENMYNATYNLYVKSLFKFKDSLASPKLQYIPSHYATRMIVSSIANRMFENDSSKVTTMHIEDKEQSKSLKVKPPFNAYSLLAIIAALAITAILITTLAFVKFSYILIVVFVLLYLLDVVFALILNFKHKFDYRFLK